MLCQSPNHKFQHALRIHWTRREGDVVVDDGEKVYFFQCAGCAKTFCHFCEGGADDMPEHCDTCWDAVFSGSGLWPMLLQAYYKTRRVLTDFLWIRKQARRDRAGAP